MKKALALVLALVLALSLGVSAFALKLVELEPDAPEAAEKIDLETLKEGPVKGLYLVRASGGDFYFELENSANLKNIEVTTKGPVTAEIVDYDPDVMENGTEDGWYLVKGDDEYHMNLNDTDEAKIWNETLANKNLHTLFNRYDWINANGEVVSSVTDEATIAIIKNLIDSKPNWTTKDVVISLSKTHPDWGLAEAGVVDVKAGYVVDTDSYEFNDTLAEGLNKLYKTRKFAAANDSVEGKLLKVTVEPNFTASYKMGAFEVTARRNDGNRKYTNVSYEGAIVSDVTIFEYEMVKWAGAEDEILSVGEYGYSDFFESGSYEGEKYDEDANREVPGASVISTTAFKALRNNKDGIEVESNGLYVTIDEIGAGQKGVNFKAKAVTAIDSKGRNVAVSGKAPVALVFGFYGNQTIASDFTVEAALGYTAYQLREELGLAMEEEDVVTYYILEGDHVVGQFTVDYANDEIDEELVLEIERSAGSTLGMYKVTTEAPSAPETEGGEENPNTGAESVLGVALAMAVVSVAAAAAVSLKK